MRDITAGKPTCSFSQGVAGKNAWRAVVPDRWALLGSHARHGDHPVAQQARARVAWREHGVLDVGGDDPQEHPRIGSNGGAARSEWSRQASGSREKPGGMNSFPATPSGPRLSTHSMAISGSSKSHGGRGPSASVCFGPSGCRCARAGASRTQATARCSPYPHSRRGASADPRRRLRGSR